MSEMEVPKGWELVKLGDTFEESNQKWLPNSKSKIINYVGLENIESNTGALVKFIPVESSKIKSSKTIFTKKTVLYGKLRPYLNKVLLPTFDGICSTDILSLTPKSNIDRKFLGYFLRSPYVLSVTKKSMQGTKMPRTKIQVLEKIKLALPPIEIQKKIIMKLDHVMSKLEEKKKEILDLQKINRYKQLIKTQKQNTLNYYFSKTFEKMKYSEIKHLNEIFTVVSGNAFKSGDFVENNGIPAITISNIGHGFFIDTKERFLPTSFAKKYPQFIVRPDCILLSLTRPFTDNNTLKVCRFPTNQQNSLLNQRVAMMVPSKKIDGDFILFQMQTDEFKKQIFGGLSTSLQPNLSSTKLPFFTLRIPNYELQVKISEEIKQKLVLVDMLSEKIHSIENMKSNLVSQITSVGSTVLDSAFSGKLVN